MKILNLCFLILFSISLSSCGGGGGTTTGNPVTVNMEDKQPFAWLKKSLDALISPARAATSNIKFCFKRLRFKPDSVTNGSNFDLFLGQVDIDPSGTNLLTVSVPSGVYQRIEFDLDKECDGVLNKPSVSFTNNNGSFSTLDHTTIKFDGNFVVDGSETITLNIDALIDNLELVNGDTQIKTALESATGDF